MGRQAAHARDCMESSAEHGSCTAPNHGSFSLACWSLTRILKVSSCPWEDFPVGHFPRCSARLASHSCLPCRHSFFCSH